VRNRIEAVSVWGKEYRDKGVKGRGFQITPEDSVMNTQPIPMTT
jgi:hypothetical protein